jgi:hypothetical protein
MVAASAVGLAWVMRGPARYMFFLWILIFSSLWELEPYAYLVMVYGTIIILDENDRRRLMMPLFVAFYVVLALIKFTLFVAALGSVAICVLVKFQQRKWREAFTLILVAIVLFLFGWMVAGQHVANLPGWIKGSLEISSGYSEAMSLLPQVRVFMAGIAALLLFLAAVVWIGKQMPVKSGAYGVLIVIISYVYLAWIHGFGRADGYHVLLFLLFLPIPFGLLFVKPLSDAVTYRVRPLLITLYAGAMVFCLLGTGFQIGGAKVVANLTGWPKRMGGNLMLVMDIARGMGERRIGREERHIAAWEGEYASHKHDLAITRRIVGNEPIDVLNYLQWAALASGLNYRPRPVFQGFLAYTPYLQRLNREYFEKPSRRPYVLFNQETIDNRFPTIDDSAAFNYVLNNYVPIARDGPFLLLRPNTKEKLDLEVIHEQTLRFGEVLDLTRWNEDPIFMTVTMRSTLFGKIVKLCVQQPPLYMNVETGNKRAQYRFVPVMGQLPFLLNPLINKTDDLLDLYARSSRTFIKKLSFERRKYLFGQLHNTFTVRLFRASTFLSSVRQTVDYQALEEMAAKREK